MKKILGILMLLVVVSAITTIVEPQFMTPLNLENLIRRAAMIGIISIGVSFVIITGGIDLSIGSVIGLTGILLGHFLTVSFTPEPSSFVVQSVDAGSRTVVVQGDAASLRAGAPMTYLDAGGAQQQFTIESFTASGDGASIVAAQEPPGLSVGATAVVVRPYIVASVDTDAKTIVLTGEPVDLKKGDRVDTMTGAKRQLTVESAARQPNGIAVVVRESVASIKAGQEASVWILQHMSVPFAVGLVLLVSLAIGLTHGLLVTKLRLQPFVVTLCGLLIYRGLAREISKDLILGFGTHFEGLKFLATGKGFSVPVPFLKWIYAGNWGRVQWDFAADAPAASPDGYTIPLDVWEWVAIPMPVVIMLVLALVGIVFLNYSVYGRYLLALGANEQAARYSGINTDRMVIAAYVICSLLAGLAGILFALELNSVQPAGQGNFYELYAIAAAVLGGCSLRGGEGSIIGVVVGACIMKMLQNSIVLMGLSNRLEFAIIGFVILAAVIVDELVKRYAAGRRSRREAAQAEKAGAPP